MKRLELRHWLSLEGWTTGEWEVDPPSDWWAERGGVRIVSYKSGSTIVRSLGDRRTLAAFSPDAPDSMIYAALRATGT